MELTPRGRRCLVVGGGPVGTRRALRLAAAGGRVDVVAPAATTQLRQAAASGDLTWSARPFAEGDVDGAFLVVCAGATAELNAQVAEAARRAGALVNRADGQPGDFRFMAELVRGPLRVGVASGVPALSVALRERLSHWLTPDRIARTEALVAARDEMGLVPAGERRALLEMAATRLCEDAEASAAWEAALAEIQAAIARAQSREATEDG